MRIEPTPPDGIFIKWGEFQIGAFGKLAIVTVLLVTVMFFVARLLSMW
jgi:hypothetical protein